MVAKLTEQQFLLNDLHGDNLMWDMKTNTLSLIDISINSFNRESELGNNKHINYSLALNTLTLLSLTLSLLLVRLL